MLVFFRYLYSSNPDLATKYGNSDIDGFHGYQGGGSINNSDTHYISKNLKLNLVSCPGEDPNVQVK